ncbi:MAG: hypothetical protein E4H27_01670 [Anaerolineales bacterium]|nr:MAG: hypothetical protein E4H27_01670 [Anaerolineales bacterium]
MAARRKKRVAQPFHFPWKVVIIGVLVNALAIWIFFGDPWYLLAEDVSLYGVSTVEIATEVLVASDLVGWHAFRLQPQKAAERVLAAVPGLVDVDINCTIFPASCEFYVTQRAPILAWHTASGVYWTDQEGRVFPAVSDRPDLPFVTGPLPAETSQYTATIRATQQGVVSLIALGVPADAFEFNQQRGLIWNDPDGRRIAFGVGPEMQMRWQVYHELVEHLEAEGIFPYVIDVRFPGGVTYSLERSW